MPLQLPHKAEQDFVALARRAVGCRACFTDLGVGAARVTLAHPRWVGQKYWKATKRILVMMLNPGGGASHSPRTNELLVRLLDSFAAGTVGIEQVFEQQKLDMPNWGRNGNGKFLNFYIHGLGLSLDDIAFANLAWCATRGDRYPPLMLSRCFEWHTRPLVQLLEPKVILLSGSATHRYQRRIQDLIPGSTIVPMLHYAHREEAAVEALELTRVRQLLKE